MDFDARLDRIESKIDELAKAFVHMARIEEQLVAMEKSRMESNTRSEARLAAAEVEINTIKDTLIAHNQKITDNHRITGTINKIFWVAITAGVVSAIGAYFTF